MLDDFFASWDLFANAWLSAWLIAGLLATLGVAVLARQQVFLGAAMSQAATACVAVSMVLAASTHAAGWLRQGGDTIVAVLGAIATALLVGLGRGHRESQTAWVFLVGSAVAMLVVAHTPHGLEEVNRMVASSLVGATLFDVIAFAVLLMLVAGVVALQGRRIVAMLLDPPYAVAAGVPVARWEWILAVVLGLSVGWALHVAGLLYAFGCLVLPGMAARHLARETRTMLWLAPLLAVLCSFVGSVAADAYDLPPAQVAVAFMAGLVPVAAGVRWLRSWA